jgi:uncharacterized membrane protein YraQ (UPF0718 family)
VRQYAVLVPVCIVAALLAYKGSASFRAIDKVRLSGALSTPSDIVAFSGAPGFLTTAERSIHYFGVIWPALAFGVLIAAAVRAYIPKDWFARILSAQTLRAQLTAGAAGASLMLCSCCVAPVFGAVYERSSRLGPSLAVMLASPSLNPAALALTFMLFAPKIAIARLLMGIATVCLGGMVIEHLFTDAFPAPLTGDRAGDTSPFLPSLFHVLLRTMPALMLGALCSTLLTLYVPKELFYSSGFGIVAIIAIATIAVPLALPTFFEIPLALGLLAAGAPAGAAAALLFAGPAVNLPSLLALGKSTNRKVAGVLAVLIWAVAIAGGLAVSV